MLATGTILALSVGALFASTPGDHLVHPYQDKDWGERGYAALLEKNLFVSPATYGRVVVRPSMGSLGEYSFALYPIANHSSAQITYTKASRNIWSDLRDQHIPRGTYQREPWEDAPLRFSRSDVKLPLSTAVAFRAALREMLRHTSGDWIGLGFDGTDIECSLAENGKIVTGVILAGLPGKNVSELRKLAYSLKTYCEAAEPQRAALAADIERRAKRFFARIKKI
jgi:hypothetical protein